MSPIQEPERLIQSIEQSIDKARPWLWQINITKEEWNAMRPEIESHPYDYPLATMAWVGRWYRDNYNRESSEWPLPGVEAKKLWEVSGLDTERFVYRTDAGLHAWQQSIYVLGGLPLRVVAANREGRLRKLLCSALAGETERLDRMVDTGDSSAALRGSIAARHSLYWYILDIVNGNRKGSDVEERTFIALMLEANKEALRDKFRLEWIITNNSSAKSFRRKLRISFRPERNLGEGENTDTHHRYLHPERLTALGLNPKSLLTMRVRYLRGVNEVAGDSIPFATWRLASDEQGFLSWGTETFASIDEVPIVAFDTVEILAREDDSDEEKVVQIFTNQDCLQLFSGDRVGQWTSRRLPGRQSAAFYSKRWQVRGALPNLTKYMGGKDGATSEMWNWAWIATSLTLESDEGLIKTFRNLATRERPMTKLWPELIDYIDGGLVEMQLTEEDEDGDLYITENKQLPLIFRKTDIGVLTETSDKVSEILPLRVEWKGNDNRYTDWREGSCPGFGPIKLRITTKSHRTFNIEVLYLPPFDDEPLIRDLDSHEIWYADDKVMVDPLEDLTSGNPIHPVIQIPYSAEGWQCSLPAWRPINRKEVLVQGKLAMVPEGDIDMPYLYRSHVELRQWNKNGFSSFDCAALPSAITLFGVVGGALRGRWLNIANEKISPAILTGEFPWLKVSLGQRRATNNDSDLIFIHWSMIDGEKPFEISPTSQEWNMPGISFQSGKRIDKNLRYRFPTTPLDPRRGLSKASEVDCFKFATEHQVYFFMFQLLHQMQEKEVWGKLTSKLDLTLPEIQTALRRYADEMNFDYYTITTPQDI